MKKKVLGGRGDELLVGDEGPEFHGGEDGVHRPREERDRLRSDRVTDRDDDCIHLETNFCEKEGGDVMRKANNKDSRKRIVRSRENG